MPDAPGQADRAAVDAATVQASFERLSAILNEMMVTVADLSTWRCPYRDRLDRCTAKFGCRNQRRSAEAGGVRTCAGDEQLDYRAAWETP